MPATHSKPMQVKEEAPETPSTTPELDKSSSGSPRLYSPRIVSSPVEEAATTLPIYTMITGNTRMEQPLQANFGQVASEFTQPDLPTVSWLCNCELCLESIQEFMRALCSSNPGKFTEAVSSMGPTYNDYMARGMQPSIHFQPDGQGSRPSQFASYISSLCSAAQYNMPMMMMPEWEKYPPPMSPYCGYYDYQPWAGAYPYTYDGSGMNNMYGPDGTYYNMNYYNQYNNNYWPYYPAQYNGTYKTEAPKDKKKSENEAKKGPEGDVMEKRGRDLKKESGNGLKKKDENGLTKESQSDLKEEAENDLKKKSETDLKEEPEKDLKEETGNDINGKLESEINRKSESDLKEKSEIDLKQKPDGELKEELASTAKMQSPENGAKKEPGRDLRKRPKNDKKQEPECDF